MSVSFRHDHAGCGRAHAHHGSEAQSYAARPFAFGTSPRNFERDRPFAIEHLALDLELDFAKRSVVGSAALTIRRVDPDAHRIDLDGVGFTVASVQLDGKSVEYTYDGRVLGAELPKGLSRGVLVITYRATPRKGLYFLDPDEHVPTRPRQAWTQFQEEDARHVFPCHDKPHVKMTTEAKVRVPKGFFVLSNGALV